MGLGLDRVRHDPKRSGNPNFEINLYKNPEKVSCPFAYAERNWVSEITTFLFDSSMATARTVKDVSPHDFVKAYASHLKRSGKVQFFHLFHRFLFLGLSNFHFFFFFQCSCSSGSLSLFVLLCVLFLFYDWRNSFFSEYSFCEYTQNKIFILRYI